MCRELNSLLLYVHKVVSLDYADIVNVYARRNPRTTYNCFIISIVVKEKFKLRILI